MRKTDDDGYVIAIEPDEVRRAIKQMVPDGAVFEIRMVNGKRNNSGYFTNADDVLKAMTNYNLDGWNIYITVQTVKAECYGRKQNKKFLEGMNTTSDQDIERYRWLFIDVDPTRATGTSSTDAQLNHAASVAKKITCFMVKYGFSQPVIAMSGNGYHLLYRIDLPNTADNTKLVEQCIGMIALHFDDDVVTIDQKVFNPSRIGKLYGTLAQKGADTKDQPHRYSRIISEADPSVVNDVSTLKALAGDMPENAMAKPVYDVRDYNFDIYGFLEKHHIGYKDCGEYKGYKRLRLDECPFNSSHKYPDSMITVQASGAIGFNCLHQSCRDKKWRDVRLLFEPDAYNSREKDWLNKWNQHRRAAADETEEPELPSEQDDDIQITDAEADNFLMSPSDIANRVEPPVTFIRTGVKKIDSLTGGLVKPGLSLVTGLRGAAKSTLISQIILQARADGQSVIAYSGELSGKQFMKWMHLQAAGLGYIQHGSGIFNDWFVEQDISNRIDEWLNEYLWVWDNKKSNTLKSLMKVLYKEVPKKRADLIVIDNLMTLDIGATKQFDKYDAQTKFVLQLKQLALNQQCHVMFVAHPRKAQGFLRLNDVSGSGNISNAVDTAYIIHRHNQDFVKGYTEFFGIKGNNGTAEQMRFADARDRMTTVVEIAKDRNGESADTMIDLYYQSGSKRLLNDPDENICYGWMTEEEKQAQQGISYVAPEDIPLPELV